MTLPPWLWLMTPAKFWVWLVNRMATWGSSWWWWHRVDSRRRRLWGMVLINALSLSALIALFFWMHQRGILG